MSKKTGMFAAGLSHSESPVPAARGNEEMSDSRHLLLEPVQWTLKWIHRVQRHDCKTHFRSIFSHRTHTVTHKKNQHWTKSFPNSNLERKSEIEPEKSAYCIHYFSTLQLTEDNLKKNNFLRNVTTSLQFGREIVSVSQEYPKGNEGQETTILLSGSSMMCGLRETLLLTKPQQLFIMFVIIAEFGGIFCTRLLRRHKITQQRFKYLPSIIHKAFAWTEYDLAN